MSTARLLPLAASVPEPGLLGRARDVVGDIAYPRVTPARAREVIEALRGAAAGQPVPLTRVADALDAVGARLGRADDPLRGRALRLLSVTTGLPAPLVQAGLDAVAGQWRRAEVEAMCWADLGDPGALDAFVAVPGAPGWRRRARPPRCCVEILPGNVFAAAATALARALVLRGPVLLKPAAGGPATAALLLDAVRETDRDVARAAAVLSWPGGARAIERAVFAEAEVVVVHGDAATVADVRERLPADVRCVTYGPRLSIAVCGRAAMRAPLAPLASALAEDVALWDQRGCLSTHVVFAETGGTAPPEALAGSLAQALAETARRLPPAPRDAALAAAVQQARGTLAMRPGAAVWAADDAGYTVTFVPGEGPLVTPGGRFVCVRPFDGPAGLAAALRPLAGRLQGVALAPEGTAADALAAVCAAAGAARLCAPGRLQSPPLGWPQDGRPALGDLVSWTLREG